MPASKAQQKAVSKYMKENYDEIKIRMAKGKKETIQTAAATAGESVNAYINTAITQRMEREGRKGPSEAAELTLYGGDGLKNSEASTSAQTAPETPEKGGTDKEGG